MDSYLDLARQTLNQQGLTENAPPKESLGRRDSVAWATATLDADALPYARIGETGDEEFVVRSLLGRGGMSDVFLVQQRFLRREVALKRARQSTRAAQTLLLREAVIASGLEHPNIVPVHAIISDEHGPAVVMKRVSGVPWDTLILQGTSGLERHLEIFSQVCNAVAFAHSRGILHLDIKPANVMIGDFGEVYLMDWGLARRTTDPPTEGLVGTPCYMAPEMTAGEASVASDVFLLGATLYEVLTGWPLYDAPDALGALTQAMTCAPAEFPDDVSEELAQVCRRATARDPAERYKGPPELRDAVSRYGEHRASSALCATAAVRVEQLDELTRAEEPAQYKHVQTLFGEARFAYEQALRTWPDSREAGDGLRRAFTTMIEYELSLGHPDAAASLLENLDDPPSELQRHVARALAQASRTEHRLAELERDADPHIGAGPRMRAYALFTITVLVMTAVIGISRAIGATSPTSTERLAYIGAFVLLAMTACAYAWQRAGWNQVNRRIATISVATLATSFLHRVAGAVEGMQASQVLVGDALILGLGGVALSLFHPAGRWLAYLAFGVALCGVAWPAWVDEMFIGLSLVIPLAVLVLLANQRPLNK